MQKGNKISIGFTETEIIELTEKYSQLKGSQINKIKSRIKYLRTLGYTKEDILLMTKKTPALLRYGVKRMKERIVEIKNLGFTLEEVLSMIKELPSLFGYATETITQRINFLISIGLHKMISKKPKNLMQSIDVTYARYRFYQEIGISIDMYNYNKLFLREKTFSKAHGINNKELIKMYPYQKEETKVLKRQQVK